MLIVTVFGMMETVQALAKNNCTIQFPKTFAVVMPNMLYGTFYMFPYRMWWNCLHVLLYKLHV